VCLLVGWSTTKDLTLYYSPTPCFLQLKFIFIFFSFRQKKNISVEKCQEFKKSEHRHTPPLSLCTCSPKVAHTPRPPPKKILTRIVCKIQISTKPIPTKFYIFYIIIEYVHTRVCMMMFNFCERRGVFSRKGIFSVT
jgi:hypothetical protein